VPSALRPGSAPRGRIANALVNSGGIAFHRETDHPSCHRAVRQEAKLWSKPHAIATILVQSCGSGRLFIVVSPQVTNVRRPLTPDCGQNRPQRRCISLHDRIQLELPHPITLRLGPQFWPSKFCASKLTRSTTSKTASRFPTSCWAALGAFHDGLVDIFASFKKALAIIMTAGSVNCKEPVNW